MKLSVIGPGRLGLHLVSAATRTHLQPVGLRDVTAPPPSESRLIPSGVVRDTWGEPEGALAGEVVVLAVPDDAIEATARQLAVSETLEGRSVLHCSGLHTSHVLRPCAERGAATASWHPLQTFPAGPPNPERWRGVAVAVEGDARAVEAGFRLARLLGAEPWSIAPRNKALYHAAASVAANLTHVLVSEGRRLLARSGMSPEHARRALDLLVGESVRAALESEDLEALTGPLVRGDDSTVNRHLEVLPPRLAEAYRALAQLVASRR